MGALSAERGLAAGSRAPRPVSSRTSSERRAGRRIAHRTVRNGALAEQVALGGDDRARPPTRRPALRRPARRPPGCRRPSSRARGRRRRRSRRRRRPAVVRSGSPARSAVPRRSRSGARPATPIATSVVPCRNGRPNESVTITATSLPVRSTSVDRIRRALASESSGSSTSVPGSGAFEWSTPAEAQTKPWRVSAITSAAAGADDPRRLAEDHLELPRVGAPARRARASAARARRRRAGRSGPPPSRPPSARRRRRRPPRARRRPRSAMPRSSPSRISGRPLDRQDRDHASEMPVTRIPACAL